MNSVTYTEARSSLSSSPKHCRDWPAHGRLVNGRRGHLLKQNHNSPSIKRTSSGGTSCNHPAMLTLLRRGGKTQPLASSSSSTPARQKSSSAPEPRGLPAAVYPRTRTSPLLDRGRPR